MLQKNKTDISYDQIDFSRRSQLVLKTSLRGWLFTCYKILYFPFLFTVIGAICYYAVGYPFAYGEPGNAFIGHNYFFGSNVFSPINGTQVVSNWSVFNVVKSFFLWISWFFSTRKDSLVFIRPDDETNQVFSTLEIPTRSRRRCVRGLVHRLYYCMYRHLAWRLRLIAMISTSSNDGAGHSCFSDNFKRKWNLFM